MTAPRINPAVTLALTTLLAGCVTSNNGEANSPQASGPLCRVTIESWKGTAEAQVHGQTSDVQGLMGSSTAQSWPTADTAQWEGQIWWQTLLAARSNSRV